MKQVVNELIFSRSGLYWEEWGGSHVARRLYPGTGIYCVNPRFHPKLVGWTLGLIGKFPIPVYRVKRMPPSRHPNTAHLWWYVKHTIMMMLLGMHIQLETATSEVHTYPWWAQHIHTNDDAERYIHEQEHHPRVRPCDTCTPSDGVTKLYPHDIPPQNYGNDQL